MKWRFACRRAIPVVTDLSREPKEVFDMYGPDVHKPGTIRGQLPGPAAGRAGRAVITIGLGPSFGIAPALPQLCRETDQPSARLVKDLDRCGLLKDTLVVWGGEFGPRRTARIQKNFGRDHHPRCFTMWMAGGGVKGRVFGETCEFGYNIVKGGVNVHDFHATMLHLLGIDHERLTYNFQGRRIG